MIRLNFDKDSLKTALILLLVIIILCFVIIKQCGNIRKEREKVNNLTNTINTDNNPLPVKTTIGKDTVWLYNYSTLFLNKEKAVKETGEKIIKKKDLISAMSTSTDTRDTVRVNIVKDTIINYYDGFLNLAMTLKKNIALIRYDNKDSLDFYNYIKYRHHFLFFRWGKTDSWKVYSRNPRTHISNFKVIKIMK